MDNTPPKLVILDERHRLALGKLARPGDKMFLATVDEDGTIILVPAVAVSASEVKAS